MISLRIDLEPSAWQRARINRAGFHTTHPQTRRFENDVRRMVRAQYSGWPLQGPIKAKITFYVGCPKKRVREYPCVRPDIDNFVKGVSDACNGILWQDDGQIVGLEAWKFYDWSTRKTGIEIEVEEMK